MWLCARKCIRRQLDVARKRFRNIPSSETDESVSPGSSGSLLSDRLVASSSSLCFCGFLCSVGLVQIFREGLRWREKSDWRVGAVEHSAAKPSVRPYSLAHDRSNGILRRLPRRGHRLNLKGTACIVFGAGWLAGFDLDWAAKTHPVTTRRKRG